MKTGVLAAALVLACSGCATSGEAPAAAASTEIQFITPSKDYPLENCPVSGEPVTEDGEPVAILYRGVEIQFCCRDCVAKFKADPKKYLARFEAARAGK